MMAFIVLLKKARIERITEIAAIRVVWQTCCVEPVGVVY